MSIKTIYTCDKCKKEQLTDDQFWHIGLYYNHHNSSKDFTKDIQVCRSCAESFGLLIRRSAIGDIIPIKETTIEDKIIELIKIHSENN